MSVLLRLLSFAFIVLSTTAFAAEFAEGGPVDAPAAPVNSAQSHEEAVVLYCQTNDYSIPSYSIGGYRTDAGKPCVIHHPSMPHYATGKYVIVEKYTLVCRYTGEQCATKNQDPLTLNKECECPGNYGEVHPGFVEVKGDRD